MGKKGAQKGPKIESSWVFIRFCYYLLLKVTYIERPCNYVLFPANPISVKIMLHKLWASMLSSSQITGFSDHQYLLKECINRFDIFGWNFSSRNSSIRDDYFWLCKSRHARPYPCPRPAMRVFIYCRGMTRL